MPAPAPPAVRPHQGASGIGEAAVRLFLAEGAAAVAFADRDVERGEAIAQELGAEALFVQVEMSTEADCREFIERTVAAFGRLDVLVNNAGVRSYLKVTEADEESWDTVSLFFALHPRDHPGWEAAIVLALLPSLALCHFV